MIRFTLAWELGLGNWHAVHLATLARALIARGHHVTLVLADPIGTRPVLGDLVAIPAPVHLGEVDADGAGAADFVDVLGHAGWSEPARLKALVRAWDDVFALTRPDVLVVDHAPTALLAARGRVPTLQLGLGFSCPPHDVPAFPKLQRIQPRFHAYHLLQHVHGVLDGRAPAPSTLPALFDTPRAITTLPELDPYQRHRREAALGPIEPLAPFAPLPAIPATLVYLAADDWRTELIASALASLNEPSFTVLRGAPQQGRGRWVSFESLLPSVDVVLHHGGAGTIHQASSAGRPQIVFPRYLEQALNAGILHNVGVATQVSPRRGTAFDAKSFATDIARALAWARSPDARMRARAFASIIDARADESVVGALITRCEQMARH